MRLRHLMLVTVLATVLLVPAVAEVVRPGDSDAVSVLDAISDHEQATIVYDLFGSEFAEVLTGDDPVAFFVPSDDALDGLDADALAADELEGLFQQHLSTGLAAEAPLRFIEWFATAYGEQIEVSVDGDTVILNGSIAVLDAIPARNGVVYIIDASLGS